MKNYSHHWLVDPFPDAPDNRRCPAVQSWEKSRRHGRHEKRLRTKGVMLRVVSVFGDWFFLQISARHITWSRYNIIQTRTRTTPWPRCSSNRRGDVRHVPCKAGLNSRSTVVATVEVSKAYAALTDESARKNYEKCRAKQSIWRSTKRRLSDKIQMIWMIWMIWMNQSLLGEVHKKKFLISGFSSLQVWKSWWPSPDEGQVFASVNGEGGRQVNDEDQPSPVCFLFGSN